MLITGFTEDPLPFNLNRSNIIYKEKIYEE